MEPSDQNTLPHPSDSPAPEKSPAGRFVYASGARPLSGYTIKRGVGQGGFGEIYYATSDAGKDIALKLIRRNLEVELRGIRQCLNLKHPNLLDLYDIRQDQQGDTWVVMEYVADPSLEAVLADRPTGLPQQEALLWIHGIGAGVAYLHDRGIVHRDLKPGNIFRDEGVVKVGDYGLSKFISCSRRSGHTESVGTVHYMAPEVANGRYGKELDVYAMGVILYELLTGRVPFEGESIGEVLMKHLTAKPDVSIIAEPYRSIIARALEKDPALRFRSAGEMVAALPGYPTMLPLQSESASNSCGAAVSAAQAGETHAPQTGEGVREEPIMRAVRQKSQGLLDAFGKQAAFVQVLLILLVVIVALHTWVLFMSLAIVLGTTYGVYWLAWKVTSGSVPQPIAERSAAPACGVGVPPARAAGTAAPQRAAAPGAFIPGSGVRRYGEKPMPALILKPPRERLADLLRSLLTGALAAAAMCVVMLVIGSYGSDAVSVPKPEQFAWLLLASLTGTWAVLAASKLWEGLRGDAMLRRFVLMVVGLGIGATMFAAAEFLMVKLPAAVTYSQFQPGFRAPSSFYDSYGQPLMMAYMACFGTLFLVLRWWLQADPLRRTRLSVFSVLLSILVAAIIAELWQFPQPWLPMVAGAMSVAVQLASPWERANRRKRV
ncbi:MAG: serine/threonine-protein kinase [Thermoguttaceae bacterium]